MRFHVNSQSSENFDELGNAALDAQDDFRSWQLSEVDLNVDLDMNTYFD